MKEIRGNLFAQEADAICITTNGFVKANGKAVMGRGCAHEATKRWEDIDTALGRHLNTRGNIVGLLVTSLAKPNPLYVMSFPVKPKSAACAPDHSNVVKHMRRQFKPGDSVPGWACVADPDLIINSAKQLVTIAERTGWTDIIIPRPGCGAGELSWEEIRPLLEPILDARFSIITF